MRGSGHASDKIPLFRKQTMMFNPQIVYGGILGLMIR